MKSTLRTINIGIVIKIILLLIGTVTTFLLFLDENQNEKFKYLFILPTVHTLVLLFSKSIYKNIEKHIARIILLGGYSVRNVLTPLFLFLGNYRVSTTNTENINILYAVLIMSYETIIIFTFINFEVSKIDASFNKKILDYNKIIQKRDLKGSLFSNVVLFLTLIMIFCLINVPSILSAYQNLWTADSNVIATTFSTIKDYGAGTYQRILYAFFLMFFSIMQIIWSILLIGKCRIVIGSNFLGVLISFCIIFLNTLFVSETSAYTVFVIILLLYYLILEFNSKKGLIITIGIIGGILILLLMITARTDTYSSNSSYTKIASFLNAYFPGVINNAVMPYIDAPSKFETFYYDIYKSIPLQSLIKPAFEGERLSVYFNSAGRMSFQILPFIGQSFYYFSFLGIFLQILFVYFALKWEFLSSTSNDIIHYMAYLTGAVIYSSGCTMYDLTIMITFSLKTVIPFLLLASFTQKPGIRFYLYKE